MKPTGIIRLLLFVSILAVLWNNGALAQCPNLVASPSIPICKGAPITFTIEDLPNGAVVTSWQTSNSINFNNVLTQIISSEESVTFENGFQENTFVRANILLGGIPIINFGCDNPQIGVSVEDPISLNEISSSTNIVDCQTEMPIQLTGVQNTTSADAYNYIWKFSYDQEVWNTMAGSNPDIYINQLPNESIYVIRIITPFSCDHDTSNVLYLQIENSTDPGAINDGGAYCHSTTPSALTLTGHNGEIIHWEKSLNGIDFQVINNTNGTNEIIPAAITGTTYYRTLVQKGGCDPEYSNTVSVTIYPEMVNVVNEVDQEVCANEIPEAIIGNDPTSVVSGASVLWQSKTTSQTDWDNNPSGTILTASTIEFTEPISETSSFRRVVSWGENCYSVSDTVVVFVSPQSDAGQFTDIDNEQSLCSGEEADILELEDFTGDISDWYSSTTPVGPWESLGVNSFEYAPGQITEDTYFHVKLQSGVCGEVSSSIYSIDVDQPSEAGNFTDSDNSQNLCPGSLPEPIVLENYSGEITNWFVANDPLGPWTALNHFNPIFQPDSPDQETFYKVEVQSGVCEPVFSELYSVEFYGPILHNTIYSDTTLCAGEPTPILTGDFPSGGTQTHTLLWQQKTNSSGWLDADGDNNNLDYEPEVLQETTHFRRLVIPDNGLCPSDTSNTVVVEVVEQPSGWLSGGGYYCPGEDGIEITVHLEGTPPFDYSLYDGQDSTTVYDINTNEHVITVTADSITTYTLISVSNAYCGIDENMQPSSVEIIPIQPIGEVYAGPDTAVCDWNYTLSGTPLVGEYQTCTWTDESGNVLSNESAFTFNADQRGEYEFTYTISNSLCSASDSSNVIITLDSPEAANAGEDQFICSDTTLLAAVPVEDWSGHWYLGEYEEDLYLDYEFGSGTTLRYLEHGNTYEIAWITEPVLSASTCEADTSWLTITVDPLSEAGTLSANDLQMCEGDLASLELSDFTGDVTHWLFENAEGMEVVQEGNSTFSSDNFNSNTNVSVIVQSGTCAADTTDILTLEVSPPTNPGVLNSDQQVCEGENSGTMEMTGFEGDILYWEYSNNNFETSEIIESDQTSYTFENLNTTTQFRTMVQSGYCDAEFSNIASVEVLPTVIADFTLEESYCSDEPEIELSTLIEDGLAGTWQVNGEIQSVFDPESYAGSDVTITYSNDQNACFESTTQQTYVDENPVVEISAEPEICGLNTEIAVSSSAGTGSWVVDDAIVLGGPTSEESIDIVALEYGSYELTWLALNGACSSNSSQEITFNQSPTLADAGEGQVLDFTYETELKANLPEVGTGTWSSDNANISFTDIHDPFTTVRNLEVGENKLFWTVGNGNCPISKSEVIVDVSGLIVPNAFSPNGDNINDRYVIRGLEAIGPVELEVWNRWGKTVYQSSDYQNDWTGLHQNGNELRSDTYYYLIKATSLNEIFKGFVVLQR